MTIAMIIVTNCERIDIRGYEYMDFDFNKAMVGFRVITDRKELYFQSAGAAKEFVLEIIEGIYNKQKLIDLSHFPIVTNKLNITDAMIEIQSRLKK